MSLFHRLAAPVLGVVGLLMPLAPGSAQDNAKQANTATKPEEPSSTAGQSLHRAFVEKAKKGDVDVLFLGDSITQGWNETGAKVWTERFAAWKPGNFGGGGDRTQHVLWRIGEGKELEGLDPKVIVLLIGTNNINANTPDETAAGVKAVVDSLHKQKPKAKVLLLGVFPRSGKDAKDLKDPLVAAADELHPEPKAINAKLAKLDDGKAVKYLDIGDKFLDANGGLAKTTMSDYMHLTEQGYTIWADAIAKPVEELMKK